jgi:putative membrane-bound dehydrogenase-like protein
MNRIAPLLLLVLPLTARADEPPKVLDERLKLELIAEAPVVRTPTGISIDDDGRVYVIESHTHFRPNNYDGPPADRILRFEKKGEKYEPSVFFEGTTHTMGCGFHPDGSVYVATRMEIFKLNDKNNNGRIDEGERTNLVKHETPGNYPHNGLSGFAFDFAGNVYFGQGENLGAEYKLIGSDGATLKGGGEGGNIYCMAADGSKLRRVATGFWNPFHMYMDPFGRLFAVDNDPDSRPPCRLLHVVEGGDYGYRFRNGRKGTHPFTSWNGELPGTLPMVSGTGEAPSGIVGADYLALPFNYTSALIVTSWGDHTLETFKPGWQLRANAKQTFNFGSVRFRLLVKGDDNFRPVGIAAHPDGSLWISDWVDKSYQLHGRGKLWRIRSRDAAGYQEKWRSSYRDLTRLFQAENTRDEVMKSVVAGANKLPVEMLSLVVQMSDSHGIDARQLRKAILAKGSPTSAMYLALGGSIGSPPVLSGVDLVELSRSDSVDIAYAATRGLNVKLHRRELLERLSSTDPFIQQAARWALKPAAEELAGFDFAKESRPATRLGVALVLAEANQPAGQKRIPELLSDSDPLVRFVAIKWIGEERLKDVWNQVKDDLEKRLSTRQELEAFLATSAFIADEKYDPGKESRGEEFVVKMLLDKNTTPERQAFLLRMLRADHPALTDDLLKKYLEGENAGLRLAALQVVGDRGTVPKYLDIEKIAQDKERPAEERLEAIGLLRLIGYGATLLQALESKDKLLRAQAARSLRVSEGADAFHVPLSLQEAIPPKQDQRPPVQDVAAWQKTLDAQPGDARSGALVFHHAVAQCSRCHEVGGRGAAIGPNLTGIGKSMTRERLLQSILQPSKEIAPQFAVWQLETTDGKTLKGMYLGEEVDGTVIYADEQGKTFKLHPRDVESRTQQPTSIMPEGLVYRLTDQELRDLLAFLSK